MWATIILIVFLLLVLAYLAIILSTVVGFWQTRVPFIRSGTRDTEYVLSVVGLKPGQLFVDLGSGNGQVVFIAERAASVRGVGYELTVWAYWWAKLSARMKGSGAVFYRSSFFDTSWASIDVLYCYLYPPIMSSVEEKFVREAKPGALLISRAFSLPGLTPEQVMNPPSGHPVFIYRKTK